MKKQKSKNSPKNESGLSTIRACFAQILNGTNEESCAAARRVRKLTYQSGTPDAFYDIKDIVNTAPDTYRTITEEWRQEHFVVAISVIYFLHDRRENSPDFLFPWLFELLEHSRGNVRYAAVRMFQNEIGPLTAHIRVPGLRQEKEWGVSVEQADDIIYKLAVGLHYCIKKHFMPKYAKYHYISQIPAGPYKSAQMVLADLIAACGEEYYRRLVE